MNKTKQIFESGAVYKVNRSKDALVRSLDLKKYITVPKGSLITCIDVVPYNQLKDKYYEIDVYVFLFDSNKVCITIDPEHCEWVSLYFTKIKTV